MTLLSLRAGALAVDLAPSVGGTIARFAVDGIDLLRPLSAEARAEGRASAAAAYPLVPYSNRIANGRLEVDGTAFHLAPNWPGSVHPMHGEGWRGPWQVLAQAAQAASLVQAYDGQGSWPFRYRARQDFHLDAGGLRVVLAIENLEDRPVPAGLGLHPFFVRDPDSTLAFRAAAVWLADREVLPVERVTVPPAWAHDPPRPVVSGLDNCFDGWDGRAMIAWPSRGWRLELRASDPFRHAVVYTPPGRDYFCVEPVSHANGRIAAMRLAAGATLSGTIDFRLSLSREEP